MMRARWPKTLLAAALVLTLLRALGEALALERYVSVLCGMTPSAGAAVLGLAFVAVHLAFVALAPILALAGAMGLVVVRAPRP